MPQHKTDAKVRANQRNAQKSTGPHNTTSTHLNSVKHGLLAAGVTPLDCLDYKDQLSILKANLNPVGPIENFLVERICLCITRQKRAGKLEAQFILGELNPPITRKEGGGGEIDRFLDQELNGKTIIVDPGFLPSLHPHSIACLVNTFQRYETTIENKFYRAINQLERVQRMRNGELIPSPASLDVGLHT